MAKKEKISISGIAGLAGYGSKRGCWTLVKTSKDTPTTDKYGHTAVLGDTSLLIMGGCNGYGNFTNSVYTFNLETNEWEEMNCQPSPQSRHFHSMVSYGNCLYVFGGKSNGYHSSLHALHLDRQVWKRISGTEESSGRAPIARYGHSAVVREHEMYIYGGYDADGFCSDEMFKFDFVQKQWEKLEAMKTQSREFQLDRFHHSAVGAGNVMIVFGGKNTSHVCPNHLLEYHYDTNTWSTIQTAGLAPQPRWGHCAALSGDNMFLFGGCDGPSEFADLYQYQIASRTWLLVEVDWCPVPRYFASASCRENTLYIYGGKNKMNKCFGDIYALHLSSEDGDEPKSPSSRRSKKRSKGKKRIKRKKSTLRGSQNSLDASRSPREELRLKCCFDDEIRIIPIPPSIQYDALLSRLAQEYGDALLLQYKDSDGDLITVRSQSDLSVMLHEPPMSMKVFLRRYPASLEESRIHSSGSGTYPPSPSPMLSPNLPIKQLVHRWQITETELGRGAFGQVFLGMNSDTGELIAVKRVELGGSDAEQKAKVDSLQREIDVMLPLNHVNIVRYLGSQKAERFLHILLEYVPGGSIHFLLGKFKSFSESVTRSFTQQILSGLAYLHQHRIVHRDIKGANILVDNDGTIKLADFGAAKQLADILSYVNTVTGTPYWMAPEVIHGNVRSYGRKADIWSLGAVVIEMITGKPPFYDLPPMTALFRLGAAEITPDIPEELSSEGKDFLRLCFQREPDQRPSARELLQHPFVKEAGGRRVIPQDTPHAVSPSVQEQNDVVWEKGPSTNEELHTMLSYLRLESIASLS